MQACSTMSSPSFFYLWKFPSTVVIGPGFRPRLVPTLPPTSQCIQSVRQFTSPSKYCGPSIKATLPCYHRSSCLGSGTIIFRQTRSLAAPSNVFTGLDSNMKLYHTGRKTTKAIMLCKWHTWSSHRNLRQKQINQDFDLGYVSRILDGVLFRGSLGNCVELKWEAPKEKLDCLSRTTLITDARRGHRVRIEIMKPLANGPWTLEIMQERLDALLYEMTRVFSLMNTRNRVPFQRSNKRYGRSASGRRFGYGFLSRRLLREVQRKANRTLKGLPRPWDLRR